MSGTQPEPTVPAEPDAETPEVVEVVEAEIVEVEIEDDATTPVEAVAADEPPAPGATGEQPSVVYVQSPLPPAKAGNRGVGTLLAVAGAVVYTAAFAGLWWLLQVGITGDTTFRFLGTLEFYVPVVLFIVGFVVLALIANRAGWWAYVLGSLAVGVAVYLGTIGIAEAIAYFQREPVTPFGVLLQNPVLIVAGLLAREVAVWFGAIIARRGRAVTARNREARAAFEQELAAHRARYGG